MIGTVEVRCCAAQPQKPLAPVFSFKDSPQSFRILDVPKSIGTWELTRVYVGLNYPDNTNVEKDAVRQGNVWVATVEGCPVAGKTMGGFTIYADGIDEDENPVEGYVLGNGDVYVMEKSEKISALVGKTTMRYLDDIPATPSKGDVLVIDEELKIYDGEEWVTISGGSDDTYTKAEIDEMVDEIDSSISALGDEIPTKTSDLTNDAGYITSADIPPIPTKTSDLENDSGFLTSTSTTITDIQNDVDAVENSLTEVESSVSELNTTVGQIQNDVSALDSSMTELETTVSDLDELAVKYDDDEKMKVVLNQQGIPVTLQINDATNVGDSRIIFGSTNRNHISKNSLTIGVPENGETTQHMGDTHVQIGGTQNDAYVLIGQGVTLFSSKEKGKTKMFMDDDRIFVTTPATVEEGQTLKAIKVANETAMSGRSAKKAGEMTKRDDEPQDWHWEYVSADLPSKTSDLTNDSDFITEDDVADKRDYDDLTYGGTYDPTDAEGYYGITSWHIEGLKYNGQTQPAFNTTAKFKNNQTYGTGWNDGQSVIHTSPSNPSDFSTLYLEGFGNEQPVSFTLSLDKTTYEVSYEATATGYAGHQDIILTANLANSDSLALGSELSNVEENAKSTWRTWEYEPDGLKFTAEQANSTVGMYKHGSAPDVSLEYSTDKGKTWNDFIVGTTTVTLANVGDKMILRAKTTNTTFATSSSRYNSFSMSGKIAASGSVMYLLKKDGDLDTISSEYCFYGLFELCTYMTTAPELPATTLANYCYARMFKNCVLLITAPELPATTLANYCYQEMFYRCTSLITPPELPATTLNIVCYSGMFNSCTSLTKAPELPATTLVGWCYSNMFNGCSSLNEIKIGYTGTFSETPSASFANWVSGVASTGTFYYNGSDTTRGGSAIPNNWNVVQF